MPRRKITPTLDVSRSSYHLLEIADVLNIDRLELGSVLFLRGHPKTRGKPDAGKMQAFEQVLLEGTDPVWVVPVQQLLDYLERNKIQYTTTDTGVNKCQQTQ